jgi:hypothetical protein
MGDLRILAEKFVRLSEEIEETRSQMLAALMNGAAPNPQQPARRAGGGQAMQPSHPNAKLAQAAEQRIVELLKTRGALKMTEIMAAMESRQSTTSERLRRLRQRGLVAVDAGAWTATA